MSEFFVPGSISSLKGGLKHRNHVRSLLGPRLLLVYVRRYSLCGCRNRSNDSPRCRRFSSGNTRNTAWDIWTVCNCSPVSFRFAYHLILCRLTTAKSWHSFVHCVRKKMMRNPWWCCFRLKNSHQLFSWTIFWMTLNRMSFMRQWVVSPFRNFTGSFRTSFPRGSVFSWSWSC